MKNKTQILEYTQDMTRQHELKFSIMKKAVQDFDSDRRKEYRIRYFNCKHCTYIDSRLGGAAMTPSVCQICEKGIMNPSTNIDYCCQECARNYNICSHCGAQMD